MEIELNYKIKNITTFKIGGEIKKVYFPCDVMEMKQVLEQIPNIKVLGNLSNTLISSYGYSEPIILTGRMNNIKIDGRNVVVDAGVKGPKLALEFSCINYIA